MKNFDYKEYLAEGWLFKEAETSQPLGESFGKEVRRTFKRMNPFNWGKGELPSICFYTGLDVDYKRKHPELHKLLSRVVHLHANKLVGEQFKKIEETEDIVILSAKGLSEEEAYGRYRNISKAFLEDMQEELRGLSLFDNIRTKPHWSKRKLQKGCTAYDAELEATIDDEFSVVPCVELVTEMEADNVNDKSIHDDDYLGTLDHTADDGSGELAEGNEQTPMTVGEFENLPYEEKRRLGYEAYNNLVAVKFEDIEEMDEWCQEQGWDSIPDFVDSMIQLAPDDKDWREVFDDNAQWV